MKTYCWHQPEGCETNLGFDEQVNYNDGAQRNNAARMVAKLELGARLLLGEVFGKKLHQLLIGRIRNSWEVGDTQAVGFPSAVAIA
ncbi:hypothetical protein GCM10011375_17670 [Hymenobacter qilianensis]|uniref:Uncharacterized protein n=1 Tax=Hymenobacter qilianensis TaxID=1385715 RepID=A0ACB5PQS2_9BACT|nr:hypothetical protein GCM10011375_17670 [Hymenobacter qilianensis]